MPCTIPLPQRAGLARQRLLAGAALLTLAGSIFAQSPIKPEQIKRTLIVTDNVLLAGSKISGGWREYAVDGSWRRVTFVLDGAAASVTFGDGKPGRRLPSATRYGYAGPGGKGAKAGDAKAAYSEVRVFADATPEIRSRANQPSQVPDDVATRIRELGGDIKLMQQAADIKRVSELGSALDAARNPAAAGRFFDDRPGGPPRRSGSGWNDPRAGVGRDGRASDSPSSPPEPIDEFPETTDAEGNRSSTRVVRHADGSTTTEDTRSSPDGSASVIRTEKDAHGNVTGGGGESASANGDITTGEYKRNPKTGEVFYRTVTTAPDGMGVRHSGTHHGTPSETLYSGRGGFDEAWMDQSLPWFMDALYVQWKRESDLVKSGGRISQPGRGEAPSLVINEGPDVGASAVVNCGDSNTNPCEGTEGTGEDTRGRLGALTQPPRDGLTGGPLGGTPPFPMPNPKP